MGDTHGDPKSPNSTPPLTPEHQDKAATPAFFNRHGYKTPELKTELKTARGSFRVVCCSTLMVESLGASCFQGFEGGGSRNPEREGVSKNIQNPRQDKRLKGKKDEPRAARIHASARELAFGKNVVLSLGSYFTALGDHSVARRFRTQLGMACGVLSPPSLGASVGERLPFAPEPSTPSIEPN